MTSSTSRNQRRAAQKPAKPSIAPIDPPTQVSPPVIPGDIDSYHKALVQKHGELVAFLEQLQAKAQEVVGQINQVVGEVRAVEQIKAIQAAGAKNEPPSA